MIHLTDKGNTLCGKHGAVRTMEIKQTIGFDYIVAGGFLDRSICDDCAIEYSIVQSHYRRAKKVLSSK